VTVALPAEARPERVVKISEGPGSLHPRLLDSLGRITIGSLGPTAAQSIAKWVVWSEKN
jgi:hypothetical protein